METICSATAFVFPVHENTTTSVSELATYSLLVTEEDTSVTSSETDSDSVVASSEETSSITVLASADIPAVAHEDKATHKDSEHIIKNSRLNIHTPTKNQARIL